MVKNSHSRTDQIDYRRMKPLIQTLPQDARVLFSDKMYMKCEQIEFSLLEYT